MSKEKGGPIELIPFHDDQLAAIRGQDGKGYTLVRRICDNLGVNFASQLRNLQTTHSHWAGVVIMTTPDERGSLQEHAVIPIDRLPMWLAQIKLTKVAPELREKIKVHQTEAADVLGRHFTGNVSAPPEPVGDPLLMQAKMMVAMLERQQETHHLALTANVIATEAKAVADAALSTVSGDTGYMAMVGWNRLNNIGMTSSQITTIARKLSAFCKAFVIPVRKAHHEVFGEVNSYPVELLRERIGTHCRRNGSAELLQPGMREGA